MKREIIALLVMPAVLLGVQVSPVSAEKMCKGFLPPNDMRIPVDSKEASGLTEVQFNSVLDTLQRIYSPVIAARGGNLVIKRLWSDATVNASAERQGKNYVLNMYGGLARHEGVTMDGFALVVCHELGHHIGGAPKKGASWATNEGQSDYYANLKCLRTVFSDGGTARFTRAEADDEAAVKACEEQYAGGADRALCVRGAMAGKSLARLLASLHNDTTLPRFDTPDSAVVSTMMDAHPAAQCRLDTYLQGSLCPQPLSGTLSETNPVTGSCTRSGGFTAGFRPLCWYKPSQAETLPPAFADGAVMASGEGPAFSVLRAGDPWKGL